MASALALEGYMQDYLKVKSHLIQINAKIREFLLSEIRDVDMAGTIDGGLPHLLSFSILYIDAQQLVNELDQRGFAIDSGSACNSANMEPSHVLAAMGLLTHGSVRLTIHNDATDAQVEDFLQALKDIVTRLRD